MNQWTEWEAALKSVWPHLIEQNEVLRAWFGSEPPMTTRQTLSDADSVNAHDEPWGAWATRDDDDADDDDQPVQQPVAWFGVEAAIYERGVPSSPKGVVVSLDLRLDIDSGRHIGPAVDRVTAALSRLRGARRVQYPYRSLDRASETGSENSPPQVLVLSDTTGHDHLGRAVWISFRLIAVDRSDAPRRAIDAAVRRVLTHIDWIRDAAHEAQGALAGWTPRLSREVVTGWAGEVVARCRLDDGGLRYGAWRDPYDLRGDGEWVEVKTTLQESEGLGHWSREELDLAVRARSQLRLVAVRVDRALVDELLDVLTNAEASVPSSCEMSVDARRLAAALEADGGRVAPAIRAVEKAIGRLQVDAGALIAVIRDPATRLGVERLDPVVAGVTLNLCALRSVLVS